MDTYAGFIGLVKERNRAKKCHVLCVLRGYEKVTSMANGNGASMLNLVCIEVTQKKKYIHPDCEDAEPLCAARGIVVLLDA